MHTAVHETLAPAADHAAADEAHADERTLDEVRVLVRHDPRPEAIAAIVRAHPALRDRIIALVQREHGNAAAHAATAPDVHAGAGLDWTTLIAAAKAGHPPAPEVHAQLVALAAARPANIAGAQQRLGGGRLGDKQWMGYGGNHGWGFAGEARYQGAAGGDDRLFALARAELFGGKTLEANLDGVVTYDGTVSIGGGFADALAATYVEKFFALDPAARATMTELGFAVTPQHGFAAIGDDGALLTGGAAHEFLRARAHGGLLDVLSALLRGDAAHASIAQHDTVDTTFLEPLRHNGVAKAMESWPDLAVRAAIHLGYWDYAGGPVANPGDYKATGGDPLALVHAFAKNMKAWIGAPNHALLVGNHGYTAQPMVGHLDRFAEGYLDGAIKAHPIVHATFDELAADPTRAGHVFVLIGAVDPRAPGTHAFYDTGPGKV